MSIHNISFCVNMLFFSILLVYSYGISAAEPLLLTKGITEYCKMNLALAPRLQNLFHAQLLNSAEHEICPANESEITNNCNIFLAKHS